MKNRLNSPIISSEDSLQISQLSQSKKRVNYNLEGQLEKIIVFDSEDHQIEIRKRKLRQIFDIKKFTMDVSDIIDALAKGQSVEQLLDRYLSQMKGKQYRELQNLVRSQEINSLKATITLTNDIQQKFDQIFKKINFNLDLLKEAVINRGQIQKVMQYYKNELTGSQYRQIQKIVQSESFTKMICKDNNKKQKIRILAKSFQIDFDIQELIQRLVKEEQYDQTLLNYKQELRGFDYKKLQAFLYSKQLTKLAKVRKQSVEEIQLRHQLKQTQIDYDFTKLIDRIVNQKDISQILNDLEDNIKGKQFRTVKRIAELYRQKIKKTTFKNQHKKSKVQQKYNDDQSLSSLGQPRKKVKLQTKQQNIEAEFHQQSVCLQNLFSKKMSRNAFLKLKKMVLNSEKISIIMETLDDLLTAKESKQLEVILSSWEFNELQQKIARKNQRKIRKSKLKQLFQIKGLKQKIDKLNHLIFALEQYQQTDQIVQELQSCLSRKQIGIVKEILQSSQLIQICGYLRGNSTKMKVINQLFKKNEIIGNFYKLKVALCQGFVVKDILDKFQDQISSKEMDKILKLLDSNELRIELKKLDMKDYDQKFRQISRLIQSIHKNKDKLVESIILGFDLKEIVQVIIFDQQYHTISELDKQLTSQSLTKYLEDNQIPKIRYTPKILVKIKANFEFVDKGTKVKDFLHDRLDRKQNIVTKINNGEILEQDDQILEPVKVIKAIQFQIYFQGSKFHLYLPNLTVEKVQPLIQKKLKTDLKLLIGIQHQKIFVQLDKTAYLQNYQRNLIYVHFSLKLLLTINQDTNEKQVRAFSYQTVEQIQQKIQLQIGIKKENQKWYIQNNQIIQIGNTIQKLGLKSELYRIYIQQMKTLQFYGFNQEQRKQNLIINRSEFKKFFIEDDDQFIEIIKKQKYLTNKFSSVFRNLTLGYIFSSIKKHSLIESSLQHVRSLVEKSEKQQPLWKPSSIKQKCFFNDTYVIHHILRYSQLPLRVDIMRGLMDNTPIPLLMYDQYGKAIKLFSQNYWILNKSFNIISFSVGEKVMGKSQFLNIVFETNFRNRNNLHKDCQGGIQIKYNIFQNDQYNVNLIDVSNQVQQQLIFELVKVCNLVIVHCLKQNDIEQWLLINKITCPIIILVRDVANAFDKEMKQERQRQKLKNSNNREKNIFNLVELSSECKKHYNIQINQIANGIQEFVRKNFQNIQKGQFWLFSDYLSNKLEEKYLKFNEILKQIEKSDEDLTQITKKFYSYKILEYTHGNQKQNKKKLQSIKKQAIKIGLAEPIKKTICFCINNFEMSSQILGKLRVYLNFLRNQIFRDFNALDDILKRSQRKVGQDFKIIKQQLLQRIKKIHSLKSSLLTKNIIIQTQKFIDQEIKFTKARDWQDIMKSIKTEFEFEILPKAFSVENFWREVIYMAKFDPNFKIKGDKNEDIPLYSSIVRLGRKDLQESQNFQFINGDLLEMPTQYLSKILQSQKEKKVMVIAIFGPQSSGKSTLLNFVLGCDFMSSAGRCTKGIYGTYFQIANKQMPNCQAILVLDTEGLFSNYENKKFSKRSGFDNKLVLFCLQVCDLVIINTKGDITKDCQQILEVAFDSQIIDTKNLPEIYFVLNFNGGQINSTQSREVQKFCDIIIKTNQQAKKVMKVNHSIGMPMAFNEIPRNSTASYITKFLKSKILPSDRFYKQTKALCFQLMGLLNQRGKERQGRTLHEAFVKMDQVWSTINKYPILTKHGNKKLKNMEEQINIWKKKKMDEFSELTNKFESEVSSIQMTQLDQWYKINQLKINKQIQIAQKEYQTQFPQISGQNALNTLIAKMFHDLQPGFKRQIMTLKQYQRQRRIKLEISEADIKGFDTINHLVKTIKKQILKSKMQLTTKQKKQRFDKCWKQRHEKMKEKLDRNNIGRQTYNTMLQIYNNLLQQKKGIKYIQLEGNLNPSFLNLNQSEQVFEKKIREMLKGSFKNNPIFEASNNPPIINIEKKKGDLSFKYLDMAKYFQISHNLIKIFIFSKELSQAIDLSTIQRVVKQRIIISDKLKKIIQIMLCQFKDIGVEINKSKFQQFFQSKVIINIFEFQVNNNSEFTLKSIDLVKFQKQVTESFSYSQKAIDLTQEFQNCKSHQWIKRIMKKKQDQNKQQRVILRVDKQLKQFLRKSLDPNDIKMLSQQLTIRKIMVKIVKYYVQKQIQKLHKDAGFMLYKKEIQRDIHLSLEQDLKKINIKPLWNMKIVQNLSLINSLTFNQIEKKPQLADQKTIRNKIKSFSQFWNHKKLQDILQIQNFQGERDKDYLHICNISQSQISVLKKYQKNQSLKKFFNRQYQDFLNEIKSSSFLKFISQELNYNISMNQIKQQCVKQNLGQKDFKNAIGIIINKVNDIIEEINKDLSQVSQKVRYDFISELHNYAFHYVWKLKEKSQWAKKVQILKDFQIKRSSQWESFFNMVSGRPDLQNLACAMKVIQIYVQTINENILQDKKIFFQKEKRSYKQNYSREKVQFLIDKHLNQTKNQKQIFEYLKNPVPYTKKFYSSLEQNAIKSVKTYQFLNHKSIIIDFLKSVIQFRDSCGNQQKYISQEIFEGQIKQNKNQYFLPLFVEVILKQNEPYVGDENKIRLKIKRGNKFSIDKIINEKINSKFLANLKKSDIEITNLKMFLISLADELKRLNDSSSGLNLKLTLQQIKQYKNSLVVQICSQVCPCCKRNCDIDLQFSKNHTIHKCNSGHQMRAIGGIRIKYQQNQQKKFKASIQRCQDIAEDGEFQFNNKSYRWCQFKLQKKNEWDFNSHPDKHSQIFFKHYWEKAGHLICQYFEKQDKVCMEYVPYDARELKSQSRQIKDMEPTNYIFALDESSSMRGQKWNQLMDAMRKNITEVSNINKNNNQYLTIYKFNQNVTIICQLENPSGFNMSRIAFGGGRTKFSPVFKQGYQIMDRHKILHNVLILISDGLAEYPHTQIQKIRLFQKTQINRGLNADYVSVLIGKGDNMMQKIRKQLGGRHNTIQRANMVANVFKEILIQKANT